MRELLILQVRGFLPRMLISLQFYSLEFRWRRLLDDLLASKRSPREGERPCVGVVAGRCPWGPRERTLGLLVVGAEGGEGEVASVRLG